jgi:aryl-alcohol dehydrogenase-like predicted oxidoreductase
MLDICLGSGFLARFFTIEKKFFLLIARLLGLRFFDTAQQYGPAEEILGATTSARCRIITKIGLSASVTTSLDSRTRWEDHYPASALRIELMASLERLRRNKCYGLLLHCISDDFDFTNHISELQKLKALGLVDNIGFSVDAHQKLPSNTDWADIIQIHVSLLSQVSTNSHQILMINGIFRGSAEKTFLEFCRLNPKKRLMMILGTHRFSRIVWQVLKYRLMSYRLRSSRLV